MQLRYYVQFKAEDKKAEYALKEKLINIEGVAIDTSVNKNKWQVPREDLQYIVETLKGAQLRVDHAESALMVVGKVVDAWLDGDRVFFRAEVGDEKLIEKIIRDYVRYVSIQVDSDEVECSKCKRSTRREGQLIHLCPGAWEVVHKPRVRELSIVASPAYENTEFQPVGFYAAMNDAQWSAIIETLVKNNVLESNLSRSSLNRDDNVGVKAPRGLQTPETKTVVPKSEVKSPMSELDAKKEASPQVAQAIVNVAPGEQAPKQVEYEDFSKKLEQLSDQIKRLSAELESVKRSIEGSEAGKKLAELAKKKGEEAEEAEEAKAPTPVSEAKKTEEAKRVAGKGIVAVDVVQQDVFANYDWFKDLLKAHSKLVGFK
ncbi:MAG: hypothetical protein QXN95_00280 [Candidatus Bathyarchaeia archaeon]